MTYSMDQHTCCHFSNVVEKEQIQKRTFTNWINAQLAKRNPPSRVSDLFADLSDGAVLLDLLEVITGMQMRRQDTYGGFRQKVDIETALEFLKEKSVKFVNINIPDVTDGKPATILGLIWTIILHCHIEEMTLCLSNSPPLASLNSVESSESIHPSLQRLLTWAQDQCHRAGCSVSVKDFMTSWRSGEAFLAMLNSFRPDLVDLAQVQTRTNLENLEQAFELAETELHIPHLLEPQDVDVPNPDEKSIITFIAQFLKYSISLSSPVTNMQPPLLPAAGFITADRPHTPLLSLNESSKKGPTAAQKAKSQMEKSRVRLQAHIQQATKLFSSKEITEAEVKRKERALKALRPALLDNFLTAVDSFGSLCSEPQLQDLKLMSDSVRKQWEDVRMEISTYINMLWSKVRERNQQQVSVLSGTNTDPAEEQQKQMPCSSPLHQEVESVRCQQDREWTGITTNLHLKSQSFSQEVIESIKCIPEVSNQMASADDDAVWVSESINKMVSKPFIISSAVLTEPTVPEDINVPSHGGSVGITEERWQEHLGANSIEEKEDVCQQNQPHGLQVLERVKDVKTLGKEDAVGTGEEKIRKRTREVKHGQRLHQKQMALLGKLIELRQSAEELGLPEPTLPALHQRSRALIKLESCLSGLHTELEHIRGASQSKRCDVTLNQELEELWEETTKAITERLEHCSLLVELLKRFQKIRGEVGETLQRAESTLKEQASYMGRDNLHRLHTKVTETKSALNDLGDSVGELRSVSRQLHSHLQQVPHCTSNIPFEPETHSLMDQWLDISERAESHFENLHFALSLWDDALKLEQEAERWAINKLSTFARSPTFCTEEDMKALQDEVRAQEESAKCFRRITAEIQVLLQTAEPPPELQVGEAHMRNKLAELKELISEAEDVFRQTEAAKTSVNGRMNECSCTLHTIHQALLCLSGHSPAAVLSKLTDLHLQLQVQDEQLHVIQEDLQLLASVGNPESTEAVCNNGHKLQERLTEVHQLFSEVEEQTQRDIQLYDRLQTEVKHFKQWLNQTVVTVNPRVVHEEVQHQRGRTEALSQLVLHLRNSTLQQSALIEESCKLLEQQNNFESRKSSGPRERSESLPTQSSIKAVEIPDGQVSEIYGIQRGQCTRSAAEDSRMCASGSVDGLKDEIQQVHKEDELWLNRQSNLQIPNVPNLNNTSEDCIPQESYWFELEICLDLLKAQLDEVSVPGRAVCDDECLGRLLQDGCHRLTSLQRNIFDCQRESTATPGFAPVPKVLQQLAAIEKDLSHHAALRDEDTRIPQHINDFLNHKRALDVSIRETASQDQQIEKDNADTVSNHQRPVFELKQSVYAEDTVRAPGLTQDKRLTLQQWSQMEQSGPSNQCSPGSDGSVYKTDTAASHSQPLHSPQHVKKIEIHESFNSEEKHISTVPGKGPNWELQESITNTIVHDPNREKNEEWTAIHVEVHAGHSATDEHSAGQNFSQDEPDFGQIEEPKGGSSLCTMKSANQNDKKVLLTADSKDNGKIGSLLKELCKLEFPGPPENTDVTAEQMTSDMDLERADGLGECSGPGEVTDGTYKHKLTMRDVLAGVQSLAENSCIINRAPRFDLSWFLKSSSNESEVQLMRTIRRVLVCRYQAAQLSLTAMMRQLQDAENLKCCVQEQVVAICNGESDVSKSMEGLCSAALLEASTTAQMKEALLEQVKKYHRHLKMTRAFLEVVATEKEKMSLDHLGSCELQAKQLGALLKTMDHKRHLIEECVKLSGQLPVHLSHTERFGVLVAHFGNIQEEWRFLEQSIKTAQQQASNLASQLCAFRQEIEQLKDQLEDLLISLQSVVTLPNFKNTMHLLSWTADVKKYSQQYANLCAQFASVAHFCISQNDKDGLKNCLDKLGSLLNESKMKLMVLTSNCRSIYSTNNNRQLQDFFIWAKQAENHIVTAETLALFPEEARIQIAEMERFQTDLHYRQAQIEEIQIEETAKEEYDQVLLALLVLYQTTSISLSQCLSSMKDKLKDREILFAHLASIDEWFTEIHIKRVYFSHVHNIQQNDITSLEKQCNSHKENVLEIEGKLKMVDEMGESCKKILVKLSFGESRYLVNRLAGVRSNINGLLAHEKAVVLELEELIHQLSKCNEDLSNVETDLEKICLDLKNLRFPLIQDSISEIVLLKYKLTQHRCQVQGLHDCQKVKRSSMLDAVDELLDKCNALGLSAVEQDKYMQLRRLMELTRDIASEHILGTKQKETSLGERFRRCQNLLVELPLVKTLCQEVADQLEAIAQDLYPTELNAERQRIQQTVETLVTLEHAVTEDIKNLESKLLLGLRFETELPATIELMQRTIQELEEAKPVDPDEKTIDVRLQRCWVLWRNMESVMRMLEGLARKQKKNLRHHEDLYVTRNAAMTECLVQMESLSQARESLKDYQWAAQGAISFLHNAEATFVSSSRGFGDCPEEQRQTQHALYTLQAGFQAHVDQLTKVIPQQQCLSHTKMETLHIEMLSQLLVRRAVLEAQAQLRLQALHRCSKTLQKHKSNHEGILRIICGTEDSLSMCAAEPINSLEQSTAQLNRAKLLMEELQVLAGQIEELRAGCLMQGCVSGGGDEVGALWRRWAALRRGAGLLMEHNEQKAEEWTDITSSIEQCTSLASLQTELPLSSPGDISEGGSLMLLGQAELHQAGLQMQQRALASLEHCLEHALSRAHSHDPTCPGPVGKTLVEIKDGIRSLKEKNRQVVEAAQEKEKETQCVMEELTELESHVLCLSSTLESCSSQRQQQEYKKELSSLHTRLQLIVDRVHSCYSKIPLDICRHLQDVQISLQRAEERVTQSSAHVEMLAGRVEELRSGLESVKEKLKQSSPSVTEAQHALKLVWDELDLWHGRLMLLESEVQDLAEDLPDQAHLLMDQLTEPLQSYQNIARSVEQHTAFLSKIPACLRQFEDILYRATCWMDEAESWLGVSCSFTTAKSLQNHSNSLQFLLEDSERIRLMLQEFRPVLCDISAVCDISVQENKLEETDRHVLTMQQTILQPLGSLLQTAVVVENLEAELKTIERNMSKIEAILSAEENDSISITEHLHNRKVILSSAQSAKEVLLDIQKVKAELDLPSDTEDKMLVFCKATSLLQRIEELEQLSVKQTTVLEDNLRTKEGCLTSKTPSDRKQDRDEAMKFADLRRIEEDKQLENVQVIDGLPREQDSLDTTESWLLSVRPWLDTSLSENMDIDLESGDLQNFKITKSQQLISSDVSTVESQTSVVMDENQRQEAHASRSSQTKTGLEDTRLVPVRPITPFAAAVSFEKEEEEHSSLSASTTEVLDTSKDTKPWSDTEEGDYKEKYNSPDKLGQCLQEKTATEQPLWTQLSEQICLDKLKQDFQVSKGETLLNGAILQQTHQSVLALRSTMCSSVSEEQDDLLEALKRVLLCLDALSGFLLTSIQSNDSSPELNECVRGELATLSELLNHIELGGNMAVSQCVSSLQRCVSTVSEQLQPQTGFTQQQQVMPNHLSFVDFLDPKQKSLFQGSGEVYILQCVLLRHLRPSPGAGAGLRQASQSLLQGINGLVELGEECTTEGRARTLCSQSELQHTLQRLETLQEVITCQLAFAHYLIQPETLKCHEDEWTQLQVRATALRQQALDQQATSHRNLQEWTQWENNCGQLGRLLDESEAFLSAEEQKGSEAEELVVQQRVDGCQRLLSKLDKSRAMLGLLLEQGENLQVTSVRQKGGALELRWKNVYRQAEQNIQRCQDMQEHWASFHTDMASLSQWLIGVREEVQKFSDLAATSDLELERVHDSLIELLDLCTEFGVMSVQKESVCRNTCPSLREQITNLESQWSQMTSALSKTQEQLQQHLLKRWLPDDLLSALEYWLKKKQVHLNTEKKETVKAKNSVHLTKCLQSLKGLQRGLEHGQLLIDFLCESGSPLVGADAIILRSERTMLAEKLGALRMRWVDLRGELENQINEAEHMHHIWVQRQKWLQHLQNLIDQKRKKLDQWKRPHSEFLARSRLLPEWEGHLESLNGIAASVEELKDTNSNSENGMQKCVGDAVFAEQVEELAQACDDIIQQFETIKPSLLQTLEKWTCFKKHLNEISLFSVRLHCSLQQLQAAPVFFLQQAERHLHDLQESHLTANIYEDIWNTLDKSYKDLVKNVDPAAAHVLTEQLEREQKRWKAVFQGLTDRMKKTQESVSAWQEFTDLTKSSSLQLQTLWCQWEELEQFPLSHQDAEARLQAIEDLQENAERVKSNLEHVLEDSKLLTGCLNPLASNIFRSQTSRLSCDALIFSQTLQMHKMRIQDDKEQMNDFKVNLEKLENQAKEIEAQMNGVSDFDCAKQVFCKLACLFSTMFDVSEMSAHVNLSNQEAQRLHTLKGRYVESLTRGLDLYKQLHFQHHLSLDFEGKRKALIDIQDVLEATSRNPQNWADLKQMAAVHQKLLGDIAIGHMLLHGLECDAVMVLENISPEQRSETLASVSQLRQKWTDVLNVTDQSRSLVKQQLNQFTTYWSGRKYLYSVFKDIDALLPLTGPTICVSPLTIQDYEDTEKAHQAHTAIYTKTVDAGRSFCDSMTDVECQMQLKTEIHALKEAWEHATSQLERRKALINKTVQKWERCQQKIAELRAELDECGLRLKQVVPAPSQDAEETFQELEFSLQHLRTEGLKEVDTMKMDLSPYVPAADSALLEKQLEQLHSQWEDLCVKVSSRKQEIADRLNAWTIFNDKNKEFCDWLTQMENKVCHSADLSFEEMVEKLKKDCMEEINLFSENKRHLKQLGEQLLWASDEAKQSQVHGSLQEANQRWHCLFHHIEARVKKLKDTLATVQQLDKNMSNLRSWLCRIEADLSRPITYSMLHHQEIQKRLAEHQELQRDIEQHTEGVASVLNLCDVLLQDEDASNGTGADGDSLLETSRSLDQRWRTICAMALDRRLRIEETWRLWCKFLDDYSRFEDWLKIAERTAANPNTGDVPYSVAKEELKKFEGFQRQVNERLTQLEIVNNQYRRLARENRTDRASQLKAMVHEGNRRWDALHRRVGTILRRLKHFTSQREDFESTRESMLVWLTELDLQLTNVEHFSESDVHHKIQQLNSFQKEITLNTERIDGLIVFGEGLIQRSSPLDAALIEEELEELHSYCQEVFCRLVRFHHRLSQPLIPVEPESPITSLSLESSLELIGRPWLGRSLSSPLATPTHLLATPLSRSGRDTPVSVDSLPLEWDHTGDVGGSSSHEDEDDEELDDEGAYFSAVSSRSVCDSPRWQTQEDLVELESDGYTEALPTLASTPLKQGSYLHLMSQCSDSIEDFKRVSLILDDEEPDEFGLTGINLSVGQSGVIERWELAQAQSQTDLRVDPQEQLPWTLDQISSWLRTVIPQLQTVLLSDPPSTVEDMSVQAKELKEMHKLFAQHKSTMLLLNLNLQGDPDLQHKLASVNQSWSKACTDLQHWDTTLRKTLLCCQEFHEKLHSLLLWLAHAESRRYAVDIHRPETTLKALKQHRNTLTDVREELVRRQTQQASLHALWTQLLPEHSDDSDEAQEKLHVTHSKMRTLLRGVTEDLKAIQQRLENEPPSDELDQRVSTVPSERVMQSMKKSSNSRERRDPAQPRSFFLRLLRAAFPLHLLLLLLLLLPCLVPLSPPEQSCTVANNFARSFYPMLRYTNGPPPT